MRTFKQVATSGSFASAARALDWSPPAVTRTIAALERSLGTRLITRTTRRMALTPVGERYLERVRSILHEVAEAGAMARQSQSVPHGPLRVIAPLAFASHQLAQRLPRFHAAHPQVTLKLTATDSVESLDEGHDVSIVVTRPALDGDFIARRLARSKVIACATPEYLDRHGRPQHPNDLAAHALIISSSGLDAQSMTFYRQPGGVDDVAASETVTVAPSRQPLASVNHELHYASALASIGIAGLASFSIDQALRERRLERVLPDWHLFDLSIWACMPSRHHVPASTRAFMDFLVEEFGKANADPWMSPTRH
jgi:DNA-binding transcriptional LysR family regulator